MEDFDQIRADYNFSIARCSNQEENTTTDKNPDDIFDRPVNEKYDEYDRNRIIFGAPGTGKSYKLNEEKDSLTNNNDNQYERVTFHPDYTYANFVGAYKPISVEVDIPASNKKQHIVKYEFVPGPFTRILVEALRDCGEYVGSKTSGANSNSILQTASSNPDGSDGEHEVIPRNSVVTDPDDISNVDEESSREIEGREERYESEDSQEESSEVAEQEGKREYKPYLLIIEEINRANVAAVFGDIFQLLDRDDKGVSIYNIQTSNELREYLAKELKGNPEDYKKLRIPSNMYIWATMNSADQGVFPMDTAFKRRWEFEYIEIDESSDKMSKYEFKANGETYTWDNLRRKINKLLTSCNVNEDKLMGPFFISKSILDRGEDAIKKAIASKVIMYLYEDAARQKRDKIFKEKNKRYSELSEAFIDKGVEIFKWTDEIKAPNPIKTNTQSQQGNSSVTAPQGQQAASSVIAPQGQQGASGAADNQDQPESLSESAE